MAEGPPPSAAADTGGRSAPEREDDAFREGSALEIEESYASAPERNSPGRRRARGRRRLVKDFAKAVVAPVVGDTRYRSFRVRLASGLVFLGSFCVVIYLGHVPLMLLIFLIQCAMVRELFALAERAQQQQTKPAAQGRAMKWYFFAVAAFFLYLRFIHTQLVVEVTSSALAAHLLGWVLQKHTILAFALYTAGFVSFVLRLEKGCYMYQFGQYAWTHLILLFVFMPSSFFVANIFDGIIWFILPCSLVIINDSGSYFAGFFFGRTPLIKLSPKKTWEGFFGGLATTVVASWFLADLLSRSAWLVCPRLDLSMGWLDCQVDPTYLPATYTLRSVHGLLPQTLAASADLVQRLLPPGAQRALEPLLTAQFRARPMQVHAVVMAAFASIIAPFGGFFASGFKRGFKIKDFGDSIPGHGGMTDRMDCQVVMAIFSYLYYHNYVGREAAVTVGSVLSAATQLGPAEQLELWTLLGNLLVGGGVLPPRVNSQMDLAAVAAHQQMPQAKFVPPR